MARSKLLIASNNIGKIQEYTVLLQGLPFELTSPVQEQMTGEPEENGTTFKENALLKARYFAKLCSHYVMADDSGLEVDVLSGEPGIYSARYAGPNTTDEERNQYLLRKLVGVPWPQRTAQFKCVIALIRPDGRETTFCGTIPGTIGLESKGTYGFGYDPIFYIPELNQTFAELGPTLKNQRSHRASAARKFALALAKELTTT